MIDENILLKDWDGIEIGQKYYPTYCYITKSMQPYEVVKDADSLWYFVMFDGSGSQVVRVFKTTTVKDFNEKWIIANKAEII